MWRWFLLFILAVGLTLFSLPDSEAKLVLCDVGQGDAILLHHQSTQILIDGGPSGDKILSCLARHTPFWDRTIELVILTHSDNDHLAGINTILSRYHVQNFATGDGLGATAEVQKLSDLLIESGVSIVPLSQNDHLKLGTFEFKVLWPPSPDLALIASLKEPSTEAVLGESTKDINDQSVVLHLTVGETTVLLTGDITTKVEAKLLAQDLLSPVDYLKVAHHGSKTSTSDTFLSHISPDYVLISAGKNNRYGHPHASVLERLVISGASILRTDRQGDIVIKLTP
jgi:competence protein ComEC